MTAEGHRNTRMYCMFIVFVCEHRGCKYDAGLEIIHLLYFLLSVLIVSENSDKYPQLRGKKNVF